ncbi:MAG: ACT domain-containing protein [Thermoplasmatota archaeon]
MTKQLVVLIENRPGALSELSSVLGRAGVNITAIMLEGSLEFGTARVHVDNVRAGQDALTEAGFQVTVGDVIVLDLPNKPGELARVCDALSHSKVNIECIFGTTSKTTSPQIILKVSDSERAKKALGIA